MPHPPVVQIYRLILDGNRNPGIGPGRQVHVGGTCDTNTPV